MAKKSKRYTEEEWLFLISNRIKELRKECGYTSYENFALDNGLDRKQYWRIENGTNLTIKTLIKILTIHNLTLDKFFIELLEKN
ncbi:MAG: helix-turn-helix transcriptional regulator [Bacteroidetes bacterium]|nr:helix-turn-helix transcriptional regulator [Bacteroidota bacterium]MBS1540180.1 helix-turn-helix transcriptional regulator [Bacteroidota bacterium]